MNIKKYFEGYRYGILFKKSPMIILSIGAVILACFGISGWGWFLFVILFVETSK